MPSQRQNQIRKSVWLLCLGITIALSIAGLTSSQWVKGGGNEVGLSKMCTGGSCSAIKISDLPPSWQATLVLLGFSVAFMIITAICVIVLLKFNRDRVLFTAKICCAFANLLLFISMLIWPIGLGSDKFVPCTGLAAKAYHMCNPWDLSTGLYLMIVAMIFMTFAMCLSTLVTSKVSQRDTERLKRKRRETQGWYDPSRPRGSKPSGEQSNTDDSHSTNSGSTLKKDKGAAAGGAAPSRLKPVKEEEPEENADIGYLMIEAKGLSGWGEPESLQDGHGYNRPSVVQNENYGDMQAGGDAQQSYFNPYFNDEEEFM
eukprot:m.88832 g.88832  ORF g.88832 m.88832 type:complete len:315 (-) comp15203_c0_seq1:1015-1959(-)